MARAGRFPYLVTVQRNNPTGDGSGDRVDVWTKFADVYAGFEPIRGRETFTAGRVAADTTHLVVMRYLAGITADMRILWGARIFDIQAVIDVRERHAELEITAIERFNQE